jgi:hypothetical protein
MSSQVYAAPAATAATAAAAATAAVFTSTFSTEAFTLPV